MPVYHGESQGIITHEAYRAARSSLASGYTPAGSSMWISRSPSNGSSLRTRARTPTPPSLLGRGWGRVGACPPQGLLRARIVCCRREIQPSPCPSLEGRGVRTRALRKRSGNSHDVSISSPRARPDSGCWRNCWPGSSTKTFVQKAVLPTTVRDRYLPAPARFPDLDVHAGRFVRKGPGQFDDGGHGRPDREAVQTQSTAVEPVSGRWPSTSVRISRTS
jgi:hypothetical protein